MDASIIDISRVTQLSPAGDVIPATPEQLISNLERARQWGGAETINIVIATSAQTALLGGPLPGFTEWRTIPNEFVGPTFVAASLDEIEAKHSPDIIRVSVFSYHRQVRTFPNDGRQRWPHLQIETKTFKRSPASVASDLGPVAAEATVLPKAIAIPAIVGPSPIDRLQFVQQAVKTERLGPFSLHRQAVFYWLAKEFTPRQHLCVSEWTGRGLQWASDYSNWPDTLAKPKAPAGRKLMDALQTALDLLLLRADACLDAEGNPLRVQDMYMPLNDLAADWQDKTHRLLIAVGVKALIDAGTTVGPEDVVLFANLLFCSASGEHRARVAKLLTSMISDGPLSQAANEGRLVGFVAPPVGSLADPAKRFDTV